MNIEIVDALADIFPGLAAVEAAHDAAMFEAEINCLRIVGVNVNVTHMAVVRRLRIPPVFTHGLRQCFECGDLLPAIAAVFTAKQPDGLDARVYDSVIVRVHRDRANIAFEHLRPTLAAIDGAIEAVMGHPDKNCFR